MRRWRLRDADNAADSDERLVAAVRRGDDHAFELLYQRQAAMHEKYGRVLGCPFCAIGSETSCSDRVICDKIQELMTHYHRYFTAAITELQASGLAKRQDVATQVRAMAAYIHGVLGQARIQNDLEAIRNMESGAMKLLGVEPALA